MKTMSSRKQDMRCIVGILMMNAKRSSMKVLRALYLGRVGVWRGVTEGQIRTHIGRGRGEPTARLSA